jgi:hypothetical protein
MVEVAMTTTLIMIVFFGSGPYIMTRVSSGSDRIKLVAKSLPAQ